MSEKFLTKTAQKRLLKDVKDIIKHPLTDHGIFYIHDDQNITKGYACIMGPSDTIYKHGAYLLPSEDFNSVLLNLYRNGKVCLSILNTWKGEQWTSCQSIKTILLTLVTLFHNKPLLCEPGFKETSVDFIPFNKTIEFKNFQIAINNISSRLIGNFVLFKPFIKIHILQNKEAIQTKIDELQNLSEENECIKVRAYNMITKIDYSQVKSNFEKLLINYSKN